MRPHAVLIIAFLLTVNALAQGAEYYASPTGTPGGDGSWSNPWDLQTALSKTTVVKPGDIIWLRGGTYGTGGSTVFYNRHDGTQSAPIIIRAYPGERATVNGGIITDTDSSWTWFWDLEITNTSTVRVCPPSGRPCGINMLGRGLKVINCVIHDAGHPGIGYWRSVGDGGEVYGTLLWANGLYDTETPPGTPTNPWTRGSAIYAQNQDGTRYIRDVISFRNFTTGFKCYTEGGYADGFWVEGNINFDNGEWNILMASKNNPMQRMKVLSNYLYRRADDGAQSLQTGYYDTPNIDGEISDNYVMTGTSPALYVKNYPTLTVTRNTLMGRTGQGLLVQWIRGPLTSVLWDNNTYRGGATSGFRLENTSYNFAGWQAAAGVDANSTYTSAQPTGVHVAVRPNLYEPGRAHVAVFNWDLAASVNVDLSSVLRIGDRYEIRDAQNYYGAPVVTGFYDGNPVALPMNLTAVAAPVGEVPHIAWRFTHTAPQFAAFVVRRVIETWTLNLAPGWNLVSLPLRPQDPTPAAVFPPDAVASVWEYNGSNYVAPTSIDAKRGYWVYATRALSRRIVGNRPAASVQLNAGWNLIGVVGPNAGQPWQPAPTDPAVNAAWGYGPPYRVTAGQCQEGRGYWLHATAPTTIWTSP